MKWKVTDNDENNGCVKMWDGVWDNKRKVSIATNLHDFLLGFLNLIVADGSTYPSAITKFFDI